jgi:hypothetical protein
LDTIRQAVGVIVGVHVIWLPYSGPLGQSLDFLAQRFWLGGVTMTSGPIHNVARNRQAGQLNDSDFSWGCW